MRPKSAYLDFANLRIANVNSLLPLLALAGCLACSVLAQQPQLETASDFTITGIVLDSTTGSPVPRSNVTATLNHIQQASDAAATGSGNLAVNRGPGNNRFSNTAGPNRRSPAAQRDTAVTDEHGRFILALPSAGSWDLRASANGYRSQSFDSHQGFYTSIVLTPQQPTYDLSFRLAPDSTITGIVLDEAGEPVRQAQIALFNVRRSADGEGQPANFAGNRSSSASTDDRGRYELPSLAPGDYRLSVQARPWYATVPLPVNPNLNPNAPPPDTSLDVVYPDTWFPGTSDETGAATLTLHAGESRQADFQLLPVPAIHLRIPVPAEVAQSNRGRNPQVERVSGGGSFSPVSITRVNGVLDIDGLTTGLYRVQTPETTGQPGPYTLVQVTSNSSRYLDLTSATVSSATVTLTLDGASGTENLPVAFTDAAKPNNIFRSNPGRGPRGGFGGDPNTAGPSGEVGTSPQPPTSPNTATRLGRPARTIELPPGRYIVTQEGNSTLFLSGITQGSTEIPGRLVSVPAGDSALTLHIASGRAHISGIAFNPASLPLTATPAVKSPAVGAMVLLVPTTLGQSGSLTITRRDQTNTDGSFDLQNVIPGQYILIAIDRGWNIDWRDPSTLARYLTQGVPLDLRTPTTLRQTVEAQLP